MVLEVPGQVLVVVGEVEQDRLGGAAGPCACLDDAYGGLVQDIVLLPVLALSLLDIVTYGHPVVGPEDLGGGQPRILGVPLEELLLVVVEADEFLEIYGGGELTHLEV